MAQTVAELVARLTADVSGFKRGMAEAETTLSKSKASLASFGSSMKSFGRSMTLGVTLPVAGAAFVAYKELASAEAVAAQTEAAIKSTGGAANVTAGHVERLGTQLSRLSGYDDELIKSGANLLLTFKNVHNEAGRGNDIFDRATRSALNLSVAGFGDLSSTSKMLGKALNDPVLGMTALTRAGVTFSQAQKDTIKALVESGDTLGAQKLILREVESQVGGSARAYGETLAGQVGRAKEELKNSAALMLKEALPALMAIAHGALEVAQFFARLPGPVKAVIVGFVALAAVAGPLAYVIGALSTVLGVVTSPIFLVVAAIAALVAGAIALGIYWDEVWSFVANNPYVLAVLAPLGAILLPIIAIVGVIKVLADNWGAAWAWISQAATDAYNFIKPGLDAIASVALPLITFAVQYLSAAWSVAWSVISAAAQVAWGVISFVVDAIKTYLNAVSAAVSWMAGVARGAWEAFSNAVSAAWNAISGPINSILGALRSVINLAGRVSSALSSISPMSAIGGLLGLASGGPVTAGTPYIVGENGPELFVPSAGGQIIPNHALGGGGGSAIAGGAVNIFIGGSVVSERNLIDAVQEGIARNSRRGRSSS